VCVLCSLQADWNEWQDSKDMQLAPCYLIHFWTSPSVLVSILWQSGCLRRTHESPWPPPWRLPGPPSLRFTTSPADSESQAWWGLAMKGQGHCCPPTPTQPSDPALNSMIKCQPLALSASSAERGPSANKATQHPESVFQPLQTSVGGHWAKGG
jgi:hypothetical protein